MLQIEEKSWFRRLAMFGIQPLPGAARLVNRILLSSLGLKVIRSNTFVVRPHWIKQLLYFQRLFKSIENVEGDIVECAVWEGLSLCQLAILVTESRVRRHIWGFDSFEGLPPLSKEDLAPKTIAKEGALVGKEETVLRNLRSCGFDEDIIEDRFIDEHFIKEHVTLVKGWFSDTLPKYRGSSIAFLHLDPDLYQSYKTALENLWPKLSVGGIASIDAYHYTEQLPGCRKAVDEYFSQRRDAIMHKDSLLDRYYIVKVA